RHYLRIRCSWRRCAGRNHIDTGIDQLHSEFEGRVIAKRGDRDPSHWHGTHVAGIIGAGDDGEGITGIAPGVSLIDAPIAPHRFWY
ncbi:hypothetical protein CMK17_02665, partial [Candidatus Poribacteria bacterium]|nr:hypothetical protein [Candidatus Poribacteria bacterium]